MLSNLILSKPEDVEIGRHGLMIKKGPKEALFLPEVPISNRWDIHTFFDEICLKADLPLGSWHDPDAKLFVFESETWGENEFPG